MDRYEVVVEREGSFGPEQTDYRCVFDTVGIMAIVDYWVALGHTYEAMYKSEDKTIVNIHMAQMTIVLRKEVPFDMDF